MQEETLENILELLSGDNKKEQKNALKEVMTNEIVELLEEHPEYAETAILSVETHRAVKIIKFLHPDTQHELVKTLPPAKVATLLNEMHPDDRTAFLEELPSLVVKELLHLLRPEERKVTLSLLGYPKYSVGRLMNPEFIEVKENWTVQEVLDLIRIKGRDIEVINFIFVTNDKGQLIDDINLKEILLVTPDARVSDLMDDKFIALSVQDDEENAVNVFRKNNRSALPVIDANDFLLGIVTIDDVLRVANIEDTEDIQKIGGTESLDMPYMDTPFFELIRKRAGWLVILFVGELLTATAMGYFEGEISKAVVLALFIPLIISSGGNSGSQASTLIIRAMALGEISLGDWWMIMRREIFAGLTLGLILGIMGFMRVSIWSVFFSSIYGPHWLLVALTVFFSLIGVVLWGTLSGSMLPLVLKKLGADPAASSAPFVATLVDVTGLVIYFSVAFIIMRGTLL